MSFLGTVQNLSYPLPGFSVGGGDFSQRLFCQSGKGGGYFFAGSTRKIRKLTGWAFSGGFRCFFPAFFGFLVGWRGIFGGFSSFFSKFYLSTFFAGPARGEGRRLTKTRVGG